ncbi:hypothetical protein WIW90_05035 [Sulfolobaceae archaeon RB850M]
MEFTVEAFYVMGLILNEIRGSTAILYKLLTRTLNIVIMCNKLGKRLIA